MKRILTKQWLRQGSSSAKKMQVLLVLPLALPDTSKFYPQLLLLREKLLFKLRISNDPLF